MTTYKTIFILILLSQCYLISNSQTRVIKSKKDFTHKETGYVFPLHIDDFTRSSIIANDKSNRSITTTYKDLLLDNGTIISISLYPAGRGVEGRLRDEYFRSFNLLVRSSTSGNTIEHSPVSFENAGYIVNGYRSHVHKNDFTTALTLFECGKWFFRVRTSSKTMDADEIYQLETKIIRTFCPTNLVKLSPLVFMVDINFKKAAFADSLFLGCIMASALKKIEWMKEEIKTHEIASGFPDIYLEMHVASIKAMVQFVEQHPNMSRGPRTDEYLSQIMLIIDSGYLDEFIVSENMMAIKVPEGIELNCEDYNAWKVRNNINIVLPSKYYELVLQEK